MNILIINGANLNMLGRREPEIYGTQTLDEINARLREYALKKSINIDFFQSNFEGAIIEKIHACRDSYDALIINPAAHSHYSIAILDALACITIPKVEVHLSSITNRNRPSTTAAACDKMIEGLGIDSYKQAIDWLGK